MRTFGLRGALRRPLILFLAAATAVAGETTTLTVPLPAEMIDPAGSTFSVPVPQFDPVGGRVLQQVELRLTLDLSGTMGFENRDETLSAVYSLDLQWQVSLLWPDSSMIATVSAERLRSGLVGPFDGQADFAGTSGVTLQVSAEDQTAEASTADADRLDLLTGTGTINLLLAASFSGSAQSTPPVPFDSLFESGLEGELRVEYTWIPEPATIVPASMSVLALVRGACRRTR